MEQSKSQVFTVKNKQGKQKVVSIDKEENTRMVQSLLEFLRKSKTKDMFRNFEKVGGAVSGNYTSNIRYIQQREEKQVKLYKLKIMTNMRMI